HLKQPLVYRVLTLGAARNNFGWSCDAVFIDPRLGSSYILLSGDQNDLGDQRMAVKHLQRVNDDRLVLQLEILLALLRTHAGAAPGRHDDRPGSGAVSLCHHASLPHPLELRRSARPSHIGKRPALRSYSHHNAFTGLFPTVLAWQK